MADVGEEEEYESDPEQAKLSLKMRRREASDDEGEDHDDGDGDVTVRERIIDSRVSDCESDGQGAAAEYDDEEYDLVEEEEALEEVEDEVQGVRDDLDGVIVGVKRENDQTHRDVSVDEFDNNENGRVGEEVQEEKKEKEPFAVPTAGAFYMHDDRFRDSAGGRHRRTPGGSKLWELRDDKKWGHDKFEELTTEERRYDEGRRVPRGRNRARGRNRGEDRQFVRGNRPKAYDNNQTNTPKPVRGRGPRRYQPSTQNSYETPPQNRPSTKPMEKKSHTSSGRASTATSASESAQVSVSKNVVASNLNSASLPFYPSGSSNKETKLTQKKDVQTGSLNRAPLRGRNVSDSLSMDKLYIDDSASSFSGKPQLPAQTRVEGRGPMTFGQMAYQPVPHHHPNLQPSGQQFVPRSASGSRASSPPKASGPVESSEMESSTESNDFKTTLVGKGKGSISSSGTSSFSYGGLGGNHGDQNFPGGPRFLPVMQFAGQHPGGLGVPAVGMAFPGYVGQPNGMGNSEMTWLPVLAGAAGALGGTYPYITMDGAYHARPSGQPSSLPHTSKDGNTNKPANEVKPFQKPEFANDESKQRQNKARRYTEMKFDK